MYRKSQEASIYPVAIICFKIANWKVLYIVEKWEKRLFMTWKYYSNMYFMVKPVYKGINTICINMCAHFKQVFFQRP
jgi:hypothetical protein